MPAMRLFGFRQLIILFVVALGLAGCASIDSGQDVDTPIRQTDVEALREHWLPNLEGIESAVWETGSVGNDDERTIPGPTVFFAHGFATLSPEQAESYRNTYTFSECQPFEIPDTLNDVIPENQDWMCSPMFSRDIQKVEYGAVAMNSDGIIFFSLRK